MEEGGKRKEGIKHAELAERVPSDAYHHGYLDKCIKTTPSTPSQYRTDCAPQTRYTSISRTSFAIQRIPAVFEYIHIYIYIFFRCVARVVKTLHETRFQGLTFSVKRNWDPEEIELVPGRLFPGLKRARGKQSTR